MSKLRPSNASSRRTAGMEKNRELLDLCSKDVAECDIATLDGLLSLPGIDVNTADENGMTTLMHAAFKGNLVACKRLIKQGADVNWNQHSEGYTILMFTTIAGHAEVVQLLLDSGARTSAQNNIGKTAAQLGAFVGQHECVRVINNHLPKGDLDYYTSPQGLEKTPKLDPSLADPLHQLISLMTLHPVKVIQTLQSSQPPLLPAHRAVCKILRLLGERMREEERETLAMKLHCLAFVTEQCAKSDATSVLKLLLTVQQDGTPVNLDQFLRQCLREYPVLESPLLKQMVATLAKVPPGGPPSALALFQQSVFGQKSDSEEKKESCSVCGDLMDSLKKCANCKQAFYCSVECQRLGWSVGNHRKLCKKWASERETKHGKSSDVRGGVGGGGGGAGEGGGEGGGRGGGEGVGEGGGERGSEGCVEGESGESHSGAQTHPPTQN